MASRSPKTSRHWQSVRSAPLKSLLRRRDATGPDAGPVNTCRPLLRSATCCQEMRGRPRVFFPSPFFHVDSLPTRDRVTIEATLLNPYLLLATQLHGHQLTLNTSPSI